MPTLPEKQEPEGKPEKPETPQPEPGSGQSREPAGPVKPAVTLSDIAGHWAEAAIKQAVAIGVVRGYPDGTFKPNRNITRAEFTVMLAGALQLEGEGKPDAFTDREKIGAWASRAVAQAAQAGLIRGYADGSFRPEAAVTRAEMAAIVARALHLPADPKAGTGFADDAAIPQWAKGSAAALGKLGITSGRSGNRFAPNETATRAEAAVFLLRMLKTMDDR
ncbi:S-layer homology domain-containing protein [Paenibacillus sp. GCM10027626]|uniref:S-layer homology domain-containing protein n=1 Tax=Paenibacillus sp. GCM10027626 TaxID=3273411 RepID=UPI00364363B4